MKVQPWLSATFLGACLATSAPGARAAVLSQASGCAKLVIDGVPSEAAGQIGQRLPAGTVVTTGEDGRIFLQLEPGVFVGVCPGSQITLGGSLAQGAADTAGRPIPLAAVTLNSGSLVAVGNDAGLAGAVLQISTPRGNVSPVVAGGVFVRTSSPDPSDAVLSVVVGRGAALVVTPEGAPIPIDANLGIELRSSGRSVPRALAGLEMGLEGRSQIDAALDAMMQVLSSSIVDHPIKECMEKERSSDVIPALQ